MSKTKRNRGGSSPADKPPGLYWYVATWRGCEVQRCSYAAKGVWMDVLCEAYGLWPRGVVPGDLKLLAGLLGYQADIQDAAVAMLTPLVAELESANVFSRGAEIAPDLPEDAIVNRRMYRDWVKEFGRKAKAQVAAEARWAKETVHANACSGVCLGHAQGDARGMLKAMLGDDAQNVDGQGDTTHSACSDPMLRHAQTPCSDMLSECHSLPYLNDPNPKTDLNAFSGDRTLTACARAREPQSLAAIIGSPRALVDAIRHQLATLNLNGAWSTWFATTISTAPPDTLGELSDLIAYVHSCQDPVLRKAKDLSPLNDPATYLAVRWSRACVRMGATLPPFPQQETHRA